MATEKENTEPAIDTGLEGNAETIEERVFSAALICLEADFTQSPPMGPKTAARITSMISKTLEKTHTLRRVRETLSRNVEIWIWLTRILAASIPTLTARSVGPLSSLNDPEKGVSPHESTALIIMNYDSIKNDLSVLTKLMHISRNLLVNAEPQVPQDICAAVHFDQMVYQTIILCVNVTSKGYDGEILDESDRLRLAEINELYKKLLVTSLQQAHNWTAKHDRNKMSFWFDVLFDDDGALTGHDDSVSDCSGFRPEVAKQQVQHWLDRNSKMCDTARQLLRDYAETHASKPPGNLAPIRPLAWNWLPEGSVYVPPSEESDEKIQSVWKPDETNVYEQNRAYGRVSREIDAWWLKSRDPNYEEWIVDIPTPTAMITPCLQMEWKMMLQSMTIARTAINVTMTTMSRMSTSITMSTITTTNMNTVTTTNMTMNNTTAATMGMTMIISTITIMTMTTNMNDMLDDDEADDDESYGDGPLTGLLTEVPNILDPKQIEALHMIVKSCIFDSSGSGTTRAGESLQRTRCRMFLALDCGKSLLRELLVFIAVWDKDEESLIYQVTAQIVDAIHRNALIPYAWNSLRISKDIISPAQTVLLRLVNDMLGGRTVAGSGSAARDAPAGGEARDGLRDLKLVHFFFSSFRSRIVPECAALMHLQAQIREGKSDASEFPVDMWDMERAKDGLAQYLEFLRTVVEVPEMRAKLIEWEAVYELVTVLNGLEAAVPKKPLFHVPKRDGAGGEDPMVERPYAAGAAETAAGVAPPSPPLPPQQEAAHKFPWAGVKSQIFMILADLLQPPPERHSPGNPVVQMQMVRYNGIAPLLSSTAYDAHNPFAKERITVCLKWLLDGCDEANDFIRQLNRAGPPPPPASSAAGGLQTQTVRIDGVGGDVRVRVRSGRPRVVQETDDILDDGQEALVEDSADTPSGVSIEDDFMA